MHGARPIPDSLLRRASPSDAATTWRELVTGTWVVLDRSDDGQGRRLVLARYQGAPERAWHALSTRERSVVAAIAEGCSNCEAAELLGLSTSTVAGHLRSIRRKLGGVRRVDLVREWRGGGE